MYNEIYCCIFNVVRLYLCWRSWTSCLDTCRALECDLIVALVRPAIRKEKKSLCDSGSLSAVHQQTHIRLISWSKLIRDSEGRTPPLIGRGPDIAVRVCTFEDACAAAVRQREIEVSSRDAHSSFSESALLSERLTVPPGFCDR